MSKKKRKVDKSQLSIFDALQRLSEKPQHHEGQFKVVDRLRASLRSALKECALDRYQIAGEMSHLLGQTVTKEVIDSWTRESDEINGRPGRHIPAEYLPAFCQVTKCSDPLVILCQLLGLFVLPGKEALRAEIQKLDEEIREAKKRKTKRLTFLKEIEAKQ
jgi:hypothetical protein